MSLLAVRRGIALFASTLWATADQAIKDPTMELHRLSFRIKQIASTHRKWLAYWLMVLALFVCSGQLGAMIFRFGTIFIALDVVIALFTPVAIVIGLVIFAVKKQSTFLKQSLLNIVITVSLFFVAVFAPTHKLVDLIRGNPKIIARFKGTQNQATLTLRQNDRFDIWWTGVFGYSEYFTGEYHQIGDSLHFHFNGEAPRNFNGDGRLVHYRDGFATVRFYRAADQDAVSKELDFVISNGCPPE